MYNVSVTYTVYYVGYQSSKFYCIALYIHVHLMIDSLNHGWNVLDAFKGNTLLILALELEFHVLMLCTQFQCQFNCHCS